MAGTVMHLVIADRLLDQLNISNPAQFYCGNLAPDAIMNRVGYEREMKNHTHFKDGRKLYEFRIRENQDIYMVRLMDFARQFLKPGDPYYELYLGYIVHILADEIYLLEYYEDFLIQLEQKGISPEDEDFIRGFIRDVDLVDWHLVRNYKFRYPMPDILTSLSGYEIPGWIASDELEGSKHFIIKKNFLTPHEEEPLNGTTYEKNQDYIDLCVERIPQLLSERFG